MSASTRPAKMDMMKENADLNEKMKEKEEETPMFSAAKMSEEKESLVSDVNDSSQSESSSESGQEREMWSRKLEFILSLIGYSVAFGNVQRFPYLCVKNGGGAFLIPFFLLLFTCGIPLYFLEVCLGQFSGKSPLFVWRICPLFQGLGLLMVIVSGICSWYYNTIIAWSLYFLGNSFRSMLPWGQCDQWWNTDDCRIQANDTQWLPSNVTDNVTSWNYEMTSNISASVFKDASSPSLEFWKFNVLRISGGLHEMGGVQWHMALSLFGAWVLVFLCLVKGVKSVGKVVYVTAVLPYILFAVFLVRGLTLPGASEGIIYYLKPDFSRLLNTQVWIEAAIQVFYSLGPTWGGVITMASYNKFHDNCLSTSVLVSLTEGMTSFLFGFVVFATLGFMANEMGTTVKDIAENGPGIVFVTYPESITKLPFPQLWAVLFWVMMITVGLDTQFGMFETLSSGIVDAFPRHLAKKKSLVVAVLCGIFFLTGLPLSTQGGMYIYQLVDWYSAAFALVFCAFMESLIIGWIYGAERFSRDVDLMMGRPVPVLIRICWCFVCPVILAIAFLFILARYEAPTYNNYKYPIAAHVLGILLGLVPLIPVPVIMIKQLHSAKGSLSERLMYCVKPADDWLPVEQKYHDYYNDLEAPKPKTFLERIKLNLFGSQFNHSYGSSPDV